MVIVRLARSGSKGRPFFYIVATDSRNPRDGRFIEKLGYFNPIAASHEPKLKLNLARIAHWQANGAQLSPKVASLINQQTQELANEKTALKTKKPTAKPVTKKEIKAETPEKPAMSTEASSKETEIKETKEATDQETSDK